MIPTTAHTTPMPNPKNPEITPSSKKSEQVHHRHSFIHHLVPASASLHFLLSSDRPQDAKRLGEGEALLVSQGGGHEGLAALGAGRLEVVGAFVCFVCFSVCVLVLALIGVVGQVRVGGWVQSWDGHPQSIPQPHVCICIRSSRTGLDPRWHDPAKSLRAVAPRPQRAHRRGGHAVGRDQLDGKRLVGLEGLELQGVRLPCLSFRSRVCECVV